MKKLITTIALSILVVTITNAQIKKPTVKVGVTKAKTQQPSSGLLLNSSVKLKTLQDFKKLNIPVAQITKEMLDKKPTQTWIINPRKLSDGYLKLIKFTGFLRPESFLLYVREKCDSWSQTERLEALYRTEYWHEDDYSWMFPLKISFRVSGDVDYLIKLKHIKQEHPAYVPYDLKPRDFIYVVRKSLDLTYYISKVLMDNNNEFHYSFKEHNSGEISLFFSSSPKGIRDFEYMQAVDIPEVKVIKLPRD